MGFRGESKHDIPRGDVVGRLVSLTGVDHLLPDERDLVELLHGVAPRGFVVAATPKTICLANIPRQTVAAHDVVLTILAALRARAQAAVPAAHVAESVAHYIERFDFLRKSLLERYLDADHNVRTAFLCAVALYHGVDLDDNVR